MLLNLMAALSLASIGAVAGIVSNPQSVDDAELDKSFLTERKNANVFFGINDSTDEYENFCFYPLNLDSSCLLDVTLPVYQSEEDYASSLYSDPMAYTLDPVPDNGGYILDIVCNGSIDESQVYVNGLAFAYRGDMSFGFESNHVAYELYSAHLAYTGSYDFSSLDYVHIVVLDGITYADYEASHQIVSGIASGLTSVQHYATSLVSGFDALALDNGALTNSMAFAFTLLGIGTAVGICKLTFNWITGRHGM